jgi:RimJ/RimL family protein N-acetyltransferase
MSVASLLAKLNHRFGVGIQKVRLYRLHQGASLVNTEQIPGIEILVLTPDRIPLLQQQNPSIDWENWERRLGKDNECYCALRSRQLVHYTWVQTGGVHRIKRAGRDKPVNPGEFWIYECWTSNSERGRGIYPAMLSRVVRDHIESGLQEGVIYTTPQNTPSQRGILKAGFHHEQTLRSIRLGRIYIPI